MNGNELRLKLRKALLTFTAAFIALTGLSRSPARAASVEVWGTDGYGQLGNGNTVPSNSPVMVSELANGVTAVAAGGGQTLAIENGAAYAWGDNFRGELGNGTFDNSGTPVPVNGLSSGVTAIAAGESHSLAIQNGAAYAWGDDSFGDLGVANPQIQTAPAPVVGLSSGVTAIAGSEYFSLAVKNGGVYGWGRNIQGELGNGSTANNVNTPVAASILSGGVTAIACGDDHCLAIQNGKAYAWGYNYYGELGNGSTTTTGYDGIDTPGAVNGLSSGVTAVAGGGYFSLAVQNGKVFAWGFNASGQLGDGTTNNESTPEQVDPAVLNDIVSVTAAANSSYALSADGTLWVWGYNALGEMGLGTTTEEYLTPQHLLPPGGYVFTSVDANSTGDFAVATLAAVPEPVCLSLFALSALALLRRRL